MTNTIYRPSVHVRGLGAMGLALIQACPDGVYWTGWDPSIDARNKWHSFGGRVVDAIPNETDLVLSLLPSVKALNETAAVLLRTKAEKDLIWAEASTLPVEAKAAVCARFSQHGATMLDAPISGTAHTSSEGKGVFFVGGPKEPALRAIAILRRFSARAAHVGAFQNASLIKLVAQHLVMVHTAAAAEALAFSEKLGIDAHTAVDALFGTAADSSMLRQRGPLMSERRYYPAAGELSIIAKDLEIVSDKALQLSVDLPLLLAVSDRYKNAIAQDPKRDLAAIYESYAEAT